MERPKEKDNYKNLSEEIGVCYSHADPKIETKFAPINLDAARFEFFNYPELTQPNNIYDISDEYIFNKQASLEDANDLFQNAENDELTQIETEIYRENLQSRAKKIEFLKNAKLYKNLKAGPEKDELAEKHKGLNAELWGEPKEEIVKSLINDEISSIDCKNLNEDGRKLYAEFREMLGDQFLDSNEYERFRPKEETMKFLGEMARIFYADIFKRIPEKAEGELYSAAEMVKIYSDIVKGLQEESGFNSDWQVVPKENGALQVISSEKLIKIPEDRSAVDMRTLEGLLAHEIGVHMFRAEFGEQFNIAPLAEGLDGFLKSEEGIARMMEMAVSGNYSEPGVQHYINAGLAIHGNKNFREVFEINWRLEALKNNKNDYSEQEIERQKIWAFRNTQRIFRGTDDLVWTKDLAYLDGFLVEAKYIEDNLHDPRIFDILFLGGKNDTLNSNHQIIAEDLKWQNPKITQESVEEWLREVR